MKTRTKISLLILGVVGWLTIAAVSTDTSFFQNISSSGWLSLSGETNRITVANDALELDGTPIGGGGETVWTNIGGVIQPLGGQTTNRLAFTSGAADNATNVAAEVGSTSSWTGGDLLQFKPGGTQKSSIDAFGQLAIGTPAAISNNWTGGTLVYGYPILIQYNVDHGGAPDQAEIDMQNGYNSALDAYGQVNIKFATNYAALRIAAEGAGGMSVFQVGAAPDGSSLMSFDTEDLGAFSVDSAGNLAVTGKLTASGGIDPPYLLLDPNTRKDIAERVAREVPLEKGGGAALYWNQETKRVEIFVAAEGVYYGLNGETLESISPPTLKPTSPKPDRAVERLKAAGERHRNNLRKLNSSQP